MTTSATSNPHTLKINVYIYTAFKITQYDHLHYEEFSLSEVTVKQFSHIRADNFPRNQEVHVLQNREKNEL